MQTGAEGRERGRVTTFSLVYLIYGSRASGTGTGCQKSQQTVSAPAGDSNAGTPDQECQGCPGRHMANSPGATPSELIGPISTARSDTAGLRRSCDCKINHQASTFALDRRGALHTATSKMRRDGKGVHSQKGTRGHGRPTLISLSMPPDMI